jgi:hypothetical protein
MPRDIWTALEGLGQPARRKPLDLRWHLRAALQREVAAIRERTGADRGRMQFVY